MAYTETRKSDRAEMVRQLVELVQSKDVECKVESPSIWGPRAVQVEIKAPRGLRLSVDFDGDSNQPDIHVLSWHFKHGGTAKLQTTFAPSVNTCHFRKATDIAYGFDALLNIIALRLDSAISGEAFQTTQGT